MLASVSDEPIMSPRYPEISCFMYGLNDGGDGERLCGCPLMPSGRVMCMGVGVLPLRSSALS
jgi:hypothetical protein